MMEKWYESQKSNDSVVVSGRVRLARNVANFPFPLKLSQEKARELINTAYASCDDSFLKIDFEKHDHIKQQSLLEKHIISPLFLMNKSEKALMLQPDESASIMINEEDHLRIQTIFPGDNIEDAYRLAGKIDDMIEQNLDYAYDESFGYLTACPTNTGTGMRASLMLHLPALEATNTISKIIPSISKFRFTLRGIYGEGTESLGSIYQLSNQITLGFSEEQTLESLKNFAGSIIHDELEIRHKLLNDTSREFEDSILRSYGILSHAAKLNAKESMQLLSNIRMGFVSGILKYPKPKKTIYNIMMDIQPANIQTIANSTLNDSELDFIRASYIQQCLKEHE